MINHIICILLLYIIIISIIKSCSPSGSELSLENYTVNNFDGIVKRLQKQQLPVNNDQNKFENTFDASSRLQVLSIGTQFYTMHYEYFFRPELVHYITLDINEDVQVYGSSQTHIIASYLAVQNHTEKGSVDILFDNGFFGFYSGKLDTTAYVLKTLQAADHLLSVS